MSWLTDIQKVANDKVTQVGNAARQIRDQFSAKLGNSKANINTYLSSGGYTVVGINVEQIPAMKDAIRTYIDNVRTKLDELKNYDPRVAFKGEETVTALVTYIEGVKDVSEALISNLLVFCDQLTEVQRAYEAKDASNASVIRGAAQSVSSAYTTYTEQYK